MYSQYQFIHLHLFIAGLDYDESIHSLVFSGNSTLFVVVSVIDDDILESPETFCGQINAVGVPTPNVHLEPAKAVATIIDDEGVYTRSVCLLCVYCSLYTHVDQPVIKPGTNVIVITVVSAVLVFILVTAVVIVVIFVVCKKKYSKKEKQNDVPDHTYVPTPLPLKPVALHPEPGCSEYEVPTTVIKDSADNGEDQVLEHDDFTSCQNIGEGQIELKENKAYTTFKISEIENEAYTTFKTSVEPTCT